MKKGDVINGYTITKDFTTAGGGLSKWTFAEKDGKDYFIKEFLSPTYPTPDAPGSEAIKEANRLECEKFESHHRRLIQAINEKCSAGGNLIFTIDFFRHHTKYYKITEKIDVTSLNMKEISELPLETKVLILKTSAHSLNILHKSNIVHGDLKPDNVLIKQTKTGAFTSKLIDYDNSYISSAPSEVSDEVVGDMAFYSPELTKYILHDESITGKDLTVRADVFSLGLLYCLYLTGKLPEFDKAKYGYASVAANSGEKLSIDPTGLPEKLVALVNQMIEADYTKRPFLDEVFERLKTLDSATPTPTTTTPPPVAEAEAVTTPPPVVEAPKTTPPVADSPTTTETTEEPKSGGGLLKGKLLGQIDKKNKK